MNKKKVIKDIGLQELLLDPDFREFTIIGLRNEYLSRFGLGQHSTSSNLRKWIYRRVWLLTKQGKIQKRSHKTSNTIVYFVTDSYLHDLEAFKVSPQAFSAELTVEKSPSLSSLKSKLIQYQVDMLACTGECKEYQLIAAEYPHLKDQIEPLYRHAKERSSELMGQLRAINNLLQSPST